MADLTQGKLCAHFRGGQGEVNDDWQMGWELRGFNGTMRKARKAKGLSQTQLGRLVGLSCSAVGQIELLHNRPSLDVAQKLANVLEIGLAQVWPEWLEPRDRSIKLIRYQEMDEKTYSLTSAKVKSEVLQLAYESDDVDRLDFNTEAKERILRACKTLTYRERTVLELRFGLNDGYTRTIDECAHIFQLSGMRVRQIEKRALAKLKSGPRSDILLPLVSSE